MTSTRNLEGRISDGDDEAEYVNGNDRRFFARVHVRGPFGSRQSRGRHFFNEHRAALPGGTGIADLLKRRIELRRGRQSLGPISGNGEDFGYPHLLGGQMRSLVPWSRLFGDRELLAINTDPDNALSASG